MNMYPISVLLGYDDGSKILASLAVVVCVLIVVWVYCHQSGISLMRVMNETANKMRNSAIRMNSKSGSLDTASALLNKADSIPSVAHSATTNDTTPLINKDKPFTIAPICGDCTKHGLQGQSQLTSTREYQSIRGRAFY